MKLLLETNVYSITVEKILMKKRETLLLLLLIFIGNNKQKPLTLMVTLI